MKKLAALIIEQYAQKPGGRHGVSHWARVLENGRLIAEHTDANPRVIELFALFHDSKRVTETLDNGHGKRGAEFAASLRGEAFRLSDSEFDLLYYACAHHTDGMTDGDITVQACWDADRLDLGRALIKPVPDKLCTEIARKQETIEWAHQRSCEGVSPDLILDEWGLIL